MKVLRFILLLLSNIIVIPLGMVLISGIVWFSLPEISNTIIGNYVLTYLNPTNIFWITIGSAIVYTILAITQRIFAKHLPTTLRNVFIHIDGWTMGLTGIALVVFTFITANPLISEGITIANARKIGIGVCLTLLTIFHLFSNKIRTLINRKLQAYETAKEIGAVGRSSIIFVNILKVLELLFPEVLVLLIICFCTSWNVASYFIVVLVSCVFPVIGNIEADINLRKQARIDKQKADENLANMVAEKMQQNNQTQNQIKTN